jgi:transcriptional regulator with XRE-family HTH domain
MDPKRIKRFKVPLPDFNVLRTECFSYGISMGLLSRLTMISRRKITMWEKGERLPLWGELMRIESVMIVIRRAAIRAGFKQMSVMEFMYASKKERIKRQTNQAYRSRRKAREAYNLKVAQLATTGTTLATERTIEAIWPGAERRDVLDPLVGIRDTSRFDWRKVEVGYGDEGYQPRWLSTLGDKVPPHLRGGYLHSDPPAEGEKPGGNEVGESVPSGGGSNYIPSGPPTATKRNPFQIKVKPRRRR